MFENEELLESFNIPIIDKDRQYWLVRTDGGDLWEQFKVESFIGIGWNEFSDENEFAQIEKNKDLEWELKDKIRKEYKVDKPGLIINSIKRFVTQMKIGDIVMIPSDRSTIISFGEITSDLCLHELTEEDINEEKCDYVKRRNVKWIKDIYRDDLDPLLFIMFQAHHTIVNACNYADVIDRTLQNLYIKDGITHLKVDVKTQQKVGKNLFMLQKMFFDSELDVSNCVKMKINVQSPGFLEIITTHIWDIIKILLALNVAVGGGKAFGFEVPGLMSILEKIYEKKKESKKIKFEEEMEIYKEIKDIYGDDIKTLKIETSNIVLSEMIKINKSLNPEVSTDESNDDENNA
ncbi:hypothetical protein SI865_003406 [Clostridioides difficile]|nr:hypothetical protein [Clostridioides difficile]